MAQASLLIKKKHKAPLPFKESIKELNGWLALSAIPIDAIETEFGVLYEDYLSALASSRGELLGAAKAGGRGGPVKEKENKLFIHSVV